MSAETEFRAAMAAHAPLVALVGQRIAKNVLDGAFTGPYVVFTTSRNNELAISNALLATGHTFTTQCWGKTAAEAEAVAEAATAACQLAGCAVLNAASGYDEETGLEATVLTVEVWET